MIEINIADEFTKTPGARNYSDGKKSGEEFYNQFLLPRYKTAIEQGVKLKINLDATEGFPSSFLNEAFSRLGNTFPPDKVWNNLILISNEIPKYIIKIREAIYERRK